jgi:hypothetical protein
MPTFDDELSGARVLPQTRKQSRGALKAMLSKQPGRAPRREAAIRRRFRPHDDREDQATASLLNILENLRSGKLPNNKQISDALLSFRDSPTIDAQTSRLTPASQKLWNDIKDLLSTWDKVYLLY